MYTKEIKNRFGYIIISFLFALSISYYKATQLIYLFVLSSNTKNSLDPKISFIFTDVREAFSATLLTCLVFSIFSFLSFLIYSSLCFFLPSWFAYERERKLPVVCLLSFSWVCYILWVHLFIIPKACDFFFAFQVQNIDCFSVTVEPRIYSYLVWGVWSLILASFFFVFVCAFSFFIVTGKVDISNWSKSRKAGAFNCILLAALVSPPEFLTQSALCLILLVLLELIVFFAFLHNKFVNRKSTKILILNSYK
jgi:sec-independent protein translocase protein TatC